MSYLKFTNNGELQSDYDRFQCICSEACTNWAPDADRVRSAAQNFWDALDFSGARILPYNKEKK